mmetsp:Transcript_75662/g.221812  ORF Transcript_75662/g.221812 Transcript_75662/m.221812 type:complete len:255 (-) Transcript_75662:48-812(-)
MPASSRVTLGSVGTATHLSSSPAPSLAGAAASGSAGGAGAGAWGLPAAGLSAAGLPAAGLRAAGLRAAGLPAAGLRAAGLPAGSGELPLPRGVRRGRQAPSRRPSRPRRRRAGRRSCACSSARRCVGRRPRRVKSERSSWSASPRPAAPRPCLQTSSSSRRCSPAGPTATGSTPSWRSPQGGPWRLGWGKPSWTFSRSSWVQPLKRQRHRTAATPATAVAAAAAVPRLRGSLQYLQRSRSGACARLTCTASLIG